MTGITTEKLKKLSDPFPPAKVSWRVGSVNKQDKTKATALCYIDARDVMGRLDDVCGAENWQDSYVETARGRVVCTISVLINGAWVSKSDGAGDTAVEGEKGGISDSFKRAAVKWGIGRYLYDIPQQRVRVNEWKQIERGEYAKLRAALPGSRIEDEDDEHAPPPSSQTSSNQGRPHPLMIPVPMLANDAGTDWNAWRFMMSKAIDNSATLEHLNETLKANKAALGGLEQADKSAFDFLKDRAAKKRSVFQGEPPRTGTEG